MERKKFMIDFINSNLVFYQKLDPIPGQPHPDPQP